MADKVCVFDWCDEPQGIGTWTSIRGETLPVCEDHWQALREVRVRHQRASLEVGPR